VDVWAAKKSSNTAQTLASAYKAAIRAFHITVNRIHPCYNQPRVSRPKFRLDANSTVVWLYAGGISLILPDGAIWNGFPRLGHIS